MVEKDYELLYILPNKYTDNEVTPIMSKVDEMIKSAGLSLSKTENLGKRKLAYTINQFNHGYYILSEFKGVTDTLNKLNEQLGLSPEILRHSISMKVDTGIDPAKRARLRQELESAVGQASDSVEYKAPARSAASPSGKYVVNITKELGVAAKGESPIEDKINEPAPQGERLDVKQLDSKLDELLKDL